MVPLTRDPQERLLVHQELEDFKVAATRQIPRRTTGK